MKTIKGQYINLGDGSLPKADPAEVKFDLDSQEIRLSGTGSRWVRSKSRGLTVWKGELQRKMARIDLRGPLLALLNGVSYLLAAIGVLKRYAGGGGEANGG